MRDYFGFALLRSVIGLETRATLSTNQIKTKTNRELVTRVFPRLRPVTCIHFEFSLAPCDIYLCSDWPLWLLGFGSTTLSRKTL